METAFTRLVGCRLPIQLAVMGGGVGTPQLAAAVAAAGGLGMVSSTYPQPLADQLAAVDGPVGVGFFAFALGGLDDAATRARVVDVFRGDPDPALVARSHDGGALAFWQTGSRAEAQAAADAGCDAVVAQGVEAGGHVRGTTPLLELLAEVTAAIDVPVIAAGGIATGRAMRAALDAGASAVRVGTRLLATVESGAHADYVAALLAASSDDTVYTTAFGDDWPDAPHRVLRAALERAQQRGGPFSAIPPSTTTSGDVAAMAMYAGTGVGEITDAPSVATVIARMMEECELQ
jgi:NAD(P)H-dependent flavin oxidoreductase YrpB (nitropropane dioxygenase family)